MTAVYPRLMIASFLLVTINGVPLLADDPNDISAAAETDTANVADPKASADAPAGFELSDEVRDILSPLFMAIKAADVSRATVEVLSDSLINGRIVESKTSTYQIASIAANKFTIYLKEPARRTRIYNDGKSVIVAFSPDAFLRVDQTISNEQAVIGLPIPMGPYPEPILALTLAGVDPAHSLVRGMKSVEVVDEKKYRGEIPAVHLRGVQADQVIWDLWVSQKDPPKPLRMLVDLTPMLLASEEFQLPQGYSQQIRFDFLSWRVTGTVNDGLFTYTPAKDAREYESLDDYNQSIATPSDTSMQEEDDEQTTEQRKN